MSFIASSQQLKMLKQAVNDYCRDCGIVDPDERLYVAHLVSTLFDVGTVSLTDLRRGLELAMGPSPKSGEPHNQPDHHGA